MIEILSDKTVKTRKGHHCFACHRKFEPGTIMERQTNKYDGDIGTIYTCATCRELMRRFPDELYDDCEQFFPQECVVYSCQYHSVETPEDLLQKLSNLSKP